MVFDMKNNILILILVLVSLPVFSQNIYFSEPTSSHVDEIWITGEGPIAYNMYAANGWVIDWYKARLTYPDGSKSDWQNGETGGWWVTKAGTYGIEGEAHGCYVLGGCSDLYRELFYFEVVDNYAPAIPAGIGSTTYNNHPKITWSANSEYDIDDYSVYKKDGGASYNFLASTSNTYYVDNGEYIYTPGNDKIYVNYKVKANDINGNSSDLSSSVSIACNEPLSKISDNGEIDFGSPKVCKLNANYPNPFNPTTTISYQFSQSGYATLRIYNSLGEEVAELLNGFEESGYYTVIFNANNLPSGIYYVTLQMNDFSQTKKLMLVK